MILPACQEQNRSGFSLHPLRRLVLPPILAISPRQVGLLQTVSPGFLVVRDVYALDALCGFKSGARCAVYLWVRQAQRKIRTAKTGQERVAQSVFAVLFMGCGILPEKSPREIPVAKWFPYSASVKSNSVAVTSRIR